MRTAFTLVEILIVVVILGILAAIVVPRFSNASAIARGSMVADDLRVIRTQLTVYQAQHWGVSAGYPSGDTSQVPTFVAFVAQMTKASTVAGATAEPGTAGYNYGPYLREIPTNPINGKNTVDIVADGQDFPGAARDTHGWIYQPSTNLLKADCAGSDESGKAYFNY